MNSKPDLHYHDILDTEPELTVMVIMIMMMIPIRSQASVPSVSQWSTWEVPPATPFRYAIILQYAHHGHRQDDIVKNHENNGGAFPVMRRFCFSSSGSRQGRLGNLLTKISLSTRSAFLTDTVLQTLFSGKNLMFWFWCLRARFSNDNPLFSCLGAGISASEQIVFWSWWGFT